MTRRNPTTSQILTWSLAPAFLLVAAACGSTSLPGGGDPGGSAGQAGGGQAGSAQAGSGQAGSAQAGSGQAGAGQAGSGQAGAGGSVGTAGSNGSATGGAGGATPSSDAGASCSVGKIVYRNGTQGIPAPGGCGTCSCQDGDLECTLIGCAPTQVCGGLQGLSCPKGSYCQFSEAAHCGAADQTGQCAPIPQVCPDIYAPVCGCDDRTYGNACEAAGAGVSVVRGGACSPAPGACTVNGVTYADGTGNIPVPDNCNTCSCSSGKLICTRKACTVPKQCGARAGNTCTANEYCAYKEGAYCGAADAQAVCQTRPGACTLQYDPVCGCDGKTHGNACAAALAGSGVLRAGPCSGAGRSCVVGGVTYPDGAQRIPGPDGCNSCGCTDGALACNDIACPPTGSACDDKGTICAANAYCAWTEGQLCGRADGAAACLPRPEGCTAQYDPVCGCNGNTYGNACEAARAGFGVDYKGVCVN